MKQKIKKYFSDNKKKITEEIISLTSEMVSQKTVNITEDKLWEHPYLKFVGEEYRVGDIVERELAKTGIKYEKFEREKGRPNIIAKFGQNKNNKRLCIATHMDVVPPGDGWKTDPFKVIIKNERMYGRGTLDNKGPLACSLIALKILKYIIGESNLESQIQVAAFSDEELASLGEEKGAIYILNENKIDATHVIVPDIGHNLSVLDVAEKGRLVLKIIAKGKQAHGASPELGINAINRMVKLVLKLEKFKMQFKKDPFLSDPTLNLGDIQGGMAVNMVPPECSISADIRVVPGQKFEDIIEQIMSLAKEISPDFSYEILDKFEAHELDPDNELIRIVQKNTADLLGDTPKLEGMNGKTISKEFCLHGIPAIGFGPGDLNSFHVANENISLKELIDFCCLICLCALDF